MMSFSREKELIAFFKQIVPLLASRGFSLTKFFTTCNALKEIIPKNDLSLVKTLKFKDEACLQNTLGMTWKSEVIVLSLIAHFRMRTLVRVHENAFFLCIAEY